MAFQTLTKIDIASAQLNCAIDLYLDDTELVSAVTLAGAAEEILGKLVDSAGKQNSLKRRLASVQALSRHLWGFDGEEKAIVELRNRARDHFKHIKDGQEVTLDMRREAESMISRAVENYRLVVGRETKKMRQFRQRKHLQRLEENDV